MVIYSFNIKDRKTPKQKVWEDDETVITGMMWWTLQLKVFYCDALARPFHASQQAVLSGQHIWKFKCWWDNEVINVDLNEMVYFSCAQKQTYFCCTLESLECWPWLNVVLVKTYFCCASESLDVNHDWLSTYFCWASSLLTPSTAFQASHFAPPLDKGYLDHAPDDQESMKSLRLVSCDGCEWQLTSGRAFLVFQCSRRPQWPESNLRVFILLLQSGALMLRGIQVFTCL